MVISVNECNLFSYFPHCARNNARRCAYTSDMGDDNDEFCITIHRKMQINLKIATGNKVYLFVRPSVCQPCARSIAGSLRKFLKNFSIWIVFVISAKLLKNSEVIFIIFLEDGVFSSE